MKMDSRGSDDSVTQFDPRRMVFSCFEVLPLERIGPTAPAPAAAVLLGFDFGLRRIGVAVGNRLSGSATPLTTLQPVRDKPDWEGIAKLVAEWRPHLLVVGLPLTEDGGEQELTRAARRFGRRLYERYRIPVDLMDERFSSAEAEGRLGEKGRDWRQVRRDGLLDRVAAQVILENWLSGSEETQRGLTRIETDDRGLE